MAFYVDEEEVWKCSNHPSKRRRSGICPICLRERLATLCPDCASARPCSCCSTPSSYPSTSFSRFFTRNGTARLVSDPTDTELGFRRSRSVAVAGFRSRSRFGGDRDRRASTAEDTSRRERTPSFWSAIKFRRSRRLEENEKRGGVEKPEDDLWKKKEDEDAAKRTPAAAMMIGRSKSVAVMSDSSNGFRSEKGRSWNFPSPIKVFRKSKALKFLQERSPECRG